MTALRNQQVPVCACGHNVGSSDRPVEHVYSRKHAADDLAILVLAFCVAFPAGCAEMYTWATS